MEATLFLIGCCSLVNCVYGEMDLLGTRISRYAVNSTIDLRFLSTVVTVDFVNSDNCSRVVGFSMQLPLDARVSKMNMNSSTNCKLEGEVKGEKQAEAEFEQQASQGQTAALLQAYDSANYGVQVSIPPLGATRLEITFEELLRRANSQISFQLPVSPGVPVDHLVVDIVVKDPWSGVLELVVFNETNDKKVLIEKPIYDVPIRIAASQVNITYDSILDGPNPEIELPEIDIIDDVEFIFEIAFFENESTKKYATAHYEAKNVSKETSHRLPALVRAFYDTGPIPGGALLIPDMSRTCFTHLFNPGTMQSTKPLPRNFVFVIDVSGSMFMNKLNDAKGAFEKIIQKLNDDVDHVAIHAFSNEGVESFWGPEKINSENKIKAIAYVNDLETVGGTNLNGAYIEGIKRANKMQKNSTNDTDDPFVPIVIILTDGQASTGTTNSVTISREVRAANAEVNAKIYAISFGEGADYNLLSGLSIQNNGIVVKIYDGYGDAETQIEEFYQNELGSVLMSDVSVNFSGSTPIQSQTKNRWPVLAQGGELTSRVLLSRPATGTPGGIIDNPNDFIQASVIGNTHSGKVDWMTEWNLASTTQPSSGEGCVKSFAHSKIEELIAFRDATKSLGSEMKDYAPNSFYENNENINQTDSEIAEFLIKTAESEAIALALEAGIVWSGLTAMVTNQNESCDAEKKNALICDDKDGENELAVDDDDDLAFDEYDIIPYTSTTSSNAPPAAPQGQQFMASQQSFAASAPQQAFAQAGSSNVKIASFSSAKLSNAAMASLLVGVMLNSSTTASMTAAPVMALDDDDGLPMTTADKENLEEEAETEAIESVEQEMTNNENILNHNLTDNMQLQPDEAEESSADIESETEVIETVGDEDTNNENVLKQNLTDNMQQQSGETVVGTTDEAVVSTTDEAVVSTTDEAVVSTTDEAVVSTTDEAVVSTTDEAVVSTTDEPDKTGEPINSIDDSSSFSMWSKGTERMIWCIVALLSTIVEGTMFGN